MIPIKQKQLMYWFASPLDSESVSEYELCEGHFQNNQEDFIFKRSGWKLAITIYGENKRFNSSQLLLLSLDIWLNWKKTNNILNVFECNAKIVVCV